MVVYHGSDSNFKQLRISKTLIKRRSTESNEGIGIYFSLDRDVAESYGKYLYILDLNDKYILDFRKLQVCERYLNGIRTYINKETGLDIAKYINMDRISKYMYYGGISIFELGKEVWDNLDANYKFYDKNIVKQSQRDKIQRLLNNYGKKTLTAYMFNYNIKDIGVIKKIDDNIVRIVDKKRVC